MASPVASLLITILLTSGQNVVYVPGRMGRGMAGVFCGEGETHYRQGLRHRIDTLVEGRGRSLGELVIEPDR